MGILNFSRWLDEKTVNMARSPWLSPIAIQYCSAFCGFICSLMFLLGFVAADFISPIKPWWDAKHTANHYQEHTTRVRAGAAILIISGMIYLPFSAAISNQMRRLPNLHYMVHQLQLASAAAGVWTFILPGIILAATSYRPDRPVEITQAMNDFFWLCALMPFPTFMVQNFAFAYAIIVDPRKKPLFPKELAIINILVPILFTPAVGMHCTYTGPVAYNGAMGFWLPGTIFCLQLVVDAWYLFLSIREESRSDQGDVAYPDNYSKDLESGNSNNEPVDASVNIV
ncbi:integral membrane protein [Lophium mytilinum]|uniref:Integral membrane protein n=1 Tax=Lophium mytilinum TaxID=390894 RepID=A0A6A6QN41_9PEZI|nr:integral membrane protein [Lophium mytilinum]